MPTVIVQVLRQVRVNDSLGKRCQQAIKCIIIRGKGGDLKTLTYFGRTSVSHFTECLSM